MAGINMADFMEKLLDYSGRNVCEKALRGKYGGTFENPPHYPRFKYPS